VTKHGARLSYEADGRAARKIGAWEYFGRAIADGFIFRQLDRERRPAGRDAQAECGAIRRDRGKETCRPVAGLVDAFVRRPEADQRCGDRTRWQPRFVLGEQEPRQRGKSQRILTPGDLDQLLLRVIVD
jgi:hypothetical protein